MSLQARLASAGAFGCLVVAGVALIAGPGLEAGPMYPWKATSVFAAIMFMARAFLREHPFERLGPGNRVTSVRAMLVALTAGLTGEPTTPLVAATAVALALAAALLDGLDGWLARHSRMASTFGARFDVETDALLIMALSVLVWVHDKAGVWVLACGLMRYAFVAAGWLAPWMAGPLEPTLRGRTVAVLQVVGLSIALAPIVAPPASTLTASAMLATLTWSFALDVGRLWRQQSTLRL
jgi:phosphatidylglycerophosphate synthase